MTSDYLQIFNLALPGDHCSQHYDALNPRLPRQGRILRLHAIDEISLHHAGNARRTGGSRWGRRYDGIKPGPDRVKNAVATRRSAGAADPTQPANINRWWNTRFVNGRYFPRHGKWRNHPAVR